MDVAESIATLFEAEPDPALRKPRRVTAVLTAQDAARGARLLAPALRACDALGDEAAVFLLPTRGDESSLGDARATVRRILALEHVGAIPPPRPSAARGPIQGEMRHAYRLYEFLKSRAPDLVISTQAFGAPCFAMHARALNVGLQRTRFVVVLEPFEQQRRLNERLVTSRPYTLIRFQLERAAAESADLCIAPSHRFVENAIRSGAMAQTSRCAILPEIEVSGAGDPAPLPPSAFVIPNVAPLARNIAFFATLARRHPELLRDAEGRIRLHVDAAGQREEMRAVCAQRFAGTEVAWNVGGRDAVSGPGPRLFFVPCCEDFFALGDALSPVVQGAPALIGAGAAIGEPFEAAGISVPPFPDAMAEAIAEAAEGRRSLRIAARPARLEAPWTRLLGNLAPPEREETPALPRVTVCIMHFNRPRLVEAALSSALGQTCGNLEILIFDDGSDAPGAREALEALVEAHGGGIRLVRQDNRYLGAARNAAARAAGGEYVYFLDDDNVLKPHAIETLVRAAQASGADFVGSFSDIFTGEGAPDRGTVAARRILHAGDDAGFGLFNNIILDGNALCRRDAFLALGGNTEDYGVGKDDHEFFARALRSDRRVAVVPEALFWARHGQRRLKSLHFDRHAGHFRVLEAYWPVIDPRYRSLLLLLQGMFIERFETAPSSGRETPVEAPARKPSRLRSAWSRGREAVATLVIPYSWRRRRIAGAVESRERAEVRGWVLDPARPERSRKVAIHVDGLLHEVIEASAPRPDIARWKGTGGRHGFLWRIPEHLAAREGARIDVFDADTGRVLRGSPVRVRDARVMASDRCGT